LLKIVIDTNIFISALIKPGNSQKIFDFLTTGSFQAFYPTQLLEEFAEVATRPKVADKYKITTEKLKNFLAVIQRNATNIPMTNIPRICRDPTDDPFLECARLAKCDYLVSGDPDLLDLLEHGQTKIVSAAKFLQILEQQL
jgi:uncharacterized protein